MKTAILLLASPFLLFAFLFASGVLAPLVILGMLLWFMKDLIVTVCRRLP